MSAVPNSLPTARPMIVLVAGKVLRSRRFGGLTITTIITPAPDVYSRPQVVEVRSKERIGGVDEEIRVTCKLGGFERRAFQATDKSTGETTRVVPCDMTLDWVG